METGIFFIANDTMYDLAVAFLNSVRIFEPLLPLCFIPYDNSCARIKELARKYNFTVFSDTALLHACDEISSRFHGATLGQYRKLAMWEGPFSHFAYLDTDTVLLSHMQVPLQLLDEWDIVTAASDMQNIRKFVWKDTVTTCDQKIDSEYAANTGFIFSKAGSLSMKAIENRISDAITLSPHMELDYAEQALLNFLIVTSGCRYSSLSKVRRKTGRRHIPLVVWSGHCDDDLLKRRGPTLAIHWAGQWRQGEYLRSRVWRFFRDFQVDAR
jgi:hypothetical protein